MPGSIYTALSGLRTQTERLDRLSSDIANSSTAGYKGERVGAAAAERPDFGKSLDSAIDVVVTPTKSDFRTGSMTPTGQDLDLAISGDGFFTVEMPDGSVRYTRSGHFVRNADGLVSSPDGAVLMTEDGRMKLPPGQLVIGVDGTFRVGKTTIGRPVVTTFENPDRLIREDGVRFRAPDGLASTADEEAVIQNGMLEQSNVQLSEKMAQLTQVSRSFDSLSRGITVLMNDIEGRAITELGRR
jgi:flagellar basal-body rod protein FlgF